MHGAKVAKFNPDTENCHCGKKEQQVTWIDLAMTTQLNSSLLKNGSRIAKRDTYSKTISQ